MQVEVFGYKLTRDPETQSHKMDHGTVWQPQTASMQEGDTLSIKFELREPLAAEDGFGVRFHIFQSEKVPAWKFWDKKSGYMGGVYMGGTIYFVVLVIVKSIQIIWG